MKTESMPDQDLQKLRDLIKDISFAMLTTREPDGTLHSRPMHTEAMQSDGTLVFITSSSSPKATELASFPKVGLTYMSKDALACVAIAGRGRLNRDTAKLKALWKPLYKAWFPKGVDDPDVTLMEITIDRAEYWETPSSLVKRLIGTAEALLTGKSTSETLGEHKQISRKDA